MFTLLPKQINKQGGARAVDLPARSFDLAYPGVAPPLVVNELGMLTAVLEDSYSDALDVGLHS